MSSVVKPLSSVHVDYNPLMGWYTGAQKEWWCGIEGITSIWMGDWSDPLIGYKDYAINEPYFIDGYWQEFQDEYPNPPLEDRAAWNNYDKLFNEWLLEHKEDILFDLEELICNYEEEL